MTTDRKNTLWTIGHDAGLGVDPAQLDMHLVHAGTVEVYETDRLHTVLVADADGSPLAIDAIDALEELARRFGAEVIERMQDAESYWYYDALEATGAEAYYDARESDSLELADEACATVLRFGECAVTMWLRHADRGEMEWVIIPQPTGDGWELDARLEDYVETIDLDD